jgi:nicotinamidase-related amidase
VHSVPDGAPVFTPGTALAAEFAELTPTGDEPTVPKQHPSSFADTALQSIIEKSGRKKILLVGYMAHVCVSTTARDGSRLGYEVVVAEDAVGDREIPGVDAETLKRVALAEVADAFGTVIQGSDVV